MTDKKIIAVVGATGNQGGGLVRAILDDPKGEFAVRALTRKPDSPAAQELARRGAEVVTADVDDEISLRRALDGAHGAFFVTAFWEYASVEREWAQVKAMAAASAAVGLRHAIWSTLPDTRLDFPVDGTRMPILGGKYNVPHFDNKGEADQLFLDEGVPTTNLSTTFFYEGFLDFFAPKPGPDGKLVIELPMGERRLAGIAAEDIGRTALGILQRGDELVGKTIGIAGAHLTGAQYAAEFTKQLGREVVYRSIDFSTYRSSDMPGADDVASTFQYYHDFEETFIDKRDLAYIRTLNPRLQDFPTWLSQHLDAFTG